MKNVTIYCTETCPGGQKSRDYFSEQNVDFEVIDPSKSIESKQDLIEKVGVLHSPVIEIGGKFIVGYDEAAIESLLVAV